MLDIIDRRRRFDTLTEQEVLALAIFAEEEDGRIYADYAAALREEYPTSATLFDDMVAEENEHRRLLIEKYQEKFGDHIVVIQRDDVKGFYRPQPTWQVKAQGLPAMLEQVHAMEQQAQRFYTVAAQRTSDAGIRKLLGDLAEAEAAHDHAAGKAQQGSKEDEVGAEKDAAHEKFVREIIQPGLVGLMDGSVSTLAPLFAAAFATQNSWDTFLVGMAASIGAGISMGFAEALSDDGAISGRGSPWLRGVSSGVMTTVGGVGHTLPFLIPDVGVAIAVAFVVVVLELLAIAWIRHKYMDSPWGRTLMQIVLGGILVFLTGIFIGSA